MADSGKKSGFDKAKGAEKASKPDVSKKERENYAKKMWNRIEKTASVKNEVQQFKKGFEDEFKDGSKDESGRSKNVVGGIRDETKGIRDESRGGGISAGQINKKEKSDEPFVDIDSQRKRRRRHRRGKKKRMESSFGAGFGAGQNLSRDEGKNGVAVKASERGQPEPAQPEPVRPERGQPELARPERGQPEPVRPESVRPEPIRSEPINPFAASYASSAPPRHYEHRYQNEEIKPLDIDEGINDDFSEEKISSHKPARSEVDENIPINPFVSTKDEKPLDKKSFDERPLEKMDFIKEESFPEEKKDEKNAEAPEIPTGEVEAVWGGRLSDSSGISGGADISDVADIPDISGPGVKEKAPDAQMKNEREIIDVTPTELPKSDKQVVSDLGADEFKQEFWDILEQAGFTKKRIVGFFIFLGIVVFLLLFWLLEWYKIFGWGNGGGVSTKPVQEEQEESAIVEKQSFPVAAESDIYGIITSYIIGTEFAKAEPFKAEPITKWGDISGITTAFIFGETAIFQKQNFADYVDLLRKLDSIYNTDVYDLINISVDRRRALTDFLSEMDGLINKGLSAYSVLEDELVRLGAEYEAIVLQRDLYETAFFTDTENFYGESAYQNLQSFLEYSKEAVRIKTEYSSKKTLRDKFVTALNFIRPRYDDVKVNSEALIKGIRVFDVPNSDIDAIRPLE